MSDGIYLRGTILFNRDVPARRRVVILEGLRRSHFKGIGITRCGNLDQWSFDGFQWGRTFEESPTMPQLRSYLHELSRSGVLKEFRLEFHNVLSVATMSSGQIISEFAIVG